MIYAGEIKQMNKDHQELELSFTQDDRSSCE